MARYLVLDADGLVVNAVEWDGDTKKWQPLAGHSTMLNAAGDIGQTWNGDSFVEPDAPAPIVGETEALIAALVKKGVITEEDLADEKAAAAIVVL